MIDHYISNITAHEAVVLTMIGIDVSIIAETGELDRRALNEFRYLTAELDEILQKIINPENAVAKVVRFPDMPIP